MNQNDVFGCLEAKWRSFLEERGHHIYQAGGGPSVVRSRNSNKVRYRWLLLVGWSPKYTLTKSEQAYIRRHLRKAKTQKEAAYLVVGFMQEPKRIIVLPANTALKARCVGSDKGGIAWED